MASSLLAQNLKNKLSKVVQRALLISVKRNAFDVNSFQGLEVERVSETGHKAQFSLEVTQEMCHFGGFMHSGMLTALFCNTSSLHSTCLDEAERKAFTTDVNMTFVKPSGVGEGLAVHSEILKLGQKLCIADGRIINHHGDLIAAGRHTMLFTGEPGKGIQFEETEVSHGLDYL
uniref:Thioesterase domain-containing protein n=1 Tax=Chromera velia CCMP2878 TaxID=1169474 RepID=A0A0G4I8N8_9ALVE|mmetsp:Transcript_47183/g.93080  ORF Transcript_47183/g.93080 Transcript_47183/m.93080 type:complete len:174 (-) Transcript_47183:248-769(-)|eukprot:Cvel_12013.t1-p1 / transcript=Cvel_12013.t1 / gene=Cvel_12013 / organism=Chromera_velia_CCMP2878 / gene_product=Acyl-coenzyme A thioesterase 13, putative / transcript_product=Acyl-coenzyme A thioesterase 13, putative / location=Cvel_scaffold771:29373-31595(-) / protein_length=173 / sequence_SO=supercontig / SO=protein_coding / is_pseudo=false